MEDEEYRVIEFASVWRYTWGWKLQKKIFGFWVTVDEETEDGSRSWANVIAGIYNCNLYTLEGHKETWQKVEYGNK